MDSERPRWLHSWWGPLEKEDGHSQQPKPSRGEGGGRPAFPQRGDRAKVTTQSISLRINPSNEKRERAAPISANAQRRPRHVRNRPVPEPLIGGRREGSPTYFGVLGEYVVHQALVSRAQGRAAAADACGGRKKGREEEEETRRPFPTDVFFLLQRGALPLASSRGAERGVGATLLGIPPQVSPTVTFRQ